MVNVSKKELSSAKQRALFEELSKCISKLNTDQAPLFLHALFGPEERLMLAKRLVCIILLAHGQSTYKVSRSLNLSSATVSKLHGRLTAGEFDHVLETLQKRKRSYLTLLETVDSILHLGGILPHYGDTRLSHDLFPKKKKLSVN